MDEAGGQLRSALADPRSAARYVVNRTVVPWYRNASVAVSSRFPIGTHVFDREWDLLVLLDTCRVDALRAVADGYEFLDAVDSVCSVGGSSHEWMAHTFDRSRRAELAKTAYVTANAWAEPVLESGITADNERIDQLGLNRLYRFGSWETVPATALGYLEHVWRGERERGTERDRPAEAWLSTTADETTEWRPPPGRVTDRGIALARGGRFDRIILHYIQPHAPYLARAIEEGRPLARHEASPVGYLKETGDRASVWEAYLADLRWVLDDVALLVENVDGTVAVSADHGEAFGEYGVYGHSAGSLHPQIRRVPWATVDATDGGSHAPEYEPAESSERSVEDTLTALGYRV
jgi:hypothetical protein